MVEKSTFENIVILKLKGHMDLERIKEVEEVFQSSLNEGHINFIVNMLDVKDISSSGVAILLAMFRKLELNNGRMALSELSAVSDYVLDLAGLSDSFSIYHGDNEALDSFLLPDLPRRLRDV
ncbi:MAG: STAS domain-containing protein [Leptospiraceae bacterium]|nr:STAS domain-containing protein [Leptospiraceae bacterium]